MPFTDSLTAIYNDFIKKPLEAIGYSIKRADDIFKSSSIMEDIIRSIREADIIIADLTDKNPNVFYELGRAHEGEKYVIQICQKKTEIPFDLGHIRTIIYNEDPYELNNLTKSIMKYIETYMAEVEIKVKKEQVLDDKNDIQESFDEFIELIEGLYYSKARNSAGFVASIQNSSEIQKYFRVGAPKSNIPGKPDDDIEMTLLNGDYTLIPNSATLKRLNEDKYDSILNKDSSNEEKRNKLNKLYQDISSYIRRKYKFNLEIKDSLLEIKIEMND